MDSVSKRTRTFIEVCAGGGGLSAGLIKSGFTPVLLNDNNGDCCKTLKRNRITHTQTWYVGLWIKLIIHSTLIR